jgi:hypothetical protein
MRQQDQQISDDAPDVIKSEPVPVPGPGTVEPPTTDDPEGRRGQTYPSGTGDHGPEDALDERGSFDNEPDTSGPESGDRSSAADTRDELRGANRLPEERAEDDALDDDALADRSAEHNSDGDDRGTSDRGDLADASQADAGGPEAAVGSSRADIETQPDFHEPAPLPTTFGAPTVGGAVAASALAGSHRDARQEDTVRSGDGPADDRIDGIDDEPDRDHQASRGGGDLSLGAADDELDRDSQASRDPDEDRSLGAADAATGQRTDVAGVDGRPVDGAATAAPALVGASHPVNPDALSAGDLDAATGGNHGPEAGSGVVDPSGAHAGSGPEDGSGPDGGRAPDGALLPGAAEAEPIVAVLSPDTVQGFRDRWREVQLRFVDDPPGATADAHRLVEESVEALTAALAKQRDDLGGWQRDGATDTEQLRVVVRRHRDFLDRLLGR